MSITAGTSMKIEQYEEAVHRVLRESVIIIQRPIKPLSETHPVGKPIRS
jgi:hypothetical protein